MPFPRHESPSYQKFMKDFIQDSVSESNREESQLDDRFEQDLEEHHEGQAPFLRDAGSNETLTFDIKMPSYLSHSHSLGPNQIDLEPVHEFQDQDAPRTQDSPFLHDNLYQQTGFFQQDTHDDIQNENQIVDLNEIDLKELDRELLDEEEEAVEKDITDAAVEFSFNPFMMNSIDDEHFGQDHFHDMKNEYPYQQDDEGIMNLDDHDLEKLDENHQSIIPETPAKFTHHHEPTFDFDNDTNHSTPGQSTPLSVPVKNRSSHSHLDMIASLQRDLLQAHANLHSSQKESAVLKSLLQTSEDKIKELIESRKTIEREQEVTLLRVKRDLLGEKEQLLLDLKHDFQLQVSSLEKQHSSQIELLKNEKEIVDSQNSSLKNQLNKLQEELNQKTTQLEIAMKSANTTEEKNRIELQGAVNRAQIEIGAIKNEMESLSIQYKKEKQTREDNETLLIEKNEECINLSKLLEEQKQINSKLAEEKNSIVNSLKPPAPPTHQSKLLNQLNAIDTEKSVFKETLEKLFTIISPVVDIPASVTLHSPELFLESLSLLVDHTLKQSTRIEELKQNVFDVSDSIKSWKDIEKKYPEIVNTFLQDQSSLQKQQMKQVVDGLKKEYLKTYDAALGRMLEQTKHHSQMRIGVLERELKSLREWKNSVSVQGAPLSRSIHGASYSITSANSDHHNQNESPLKQKYIETLKEMRDQVDKATKTSLARLEVEWKKRAKSLDSEWKNRIAIILERYKHINGSYCICSKELFDLIK